jgi:subtilisin family serine protease
MKRALSTLALLASAFVALVPAAGGKQATDETVLVNAHDASVLPAGARFVSELGPGLRTYKLPVPGDISPESYADRLSRRDGVYAAQPNTRLKLSALASPCADPPDANSALALATSVSALSVQAPGPTAPVAVLDTGVDTATTELAGRVRTGVYTIDDSSDTSDIDGHGTEVAAIVAAAPGRFQGISPTTPVLPIKIYNKNSETTVDWVVKGIEAAVDKGAPFINLSSSNPAADVAASDASVLQQAITAAFAKGTITIVASGNEGKGDPAVPGELERVINVGSSSIEGTRDTFSNYGPWIDLVAPGASLILPAPKGVCESGYGTANGTSFAAPAVAGAAALIKSLRPSLDTQQMYDLLRMYSTKGSGDRDNDLGFGLLSVEAGSQNTAPQKQATEVDDDVYWVKQDPKQHPTYLKATKTAKLKSSVQPGKDSTDVYPVYLKKGELITASATAAKSTGLLSIGVWSPKTGSFDVSLSKTTNLRKDSEGVTNDPQVNYRATGAGTYFVSVEGPDQPDATDEKQSNTQIDPYIKYSLTLKKSAAKKKATKKKKKKKKK